MADLTRAKAGYLQSWAGHLSTLAGRGLLAGGRPIAIKARGIAGPRAGGLLLYVGESAPKAYRALTTADLALLRQAIPWRFEGDPDLHMEDRYLKVTAPWPSDLQETMIRLAELRHPRTASADGRDGGRWIVGRSESGETITASLSDRTAHWLVSGATGSGKSVALRGAVVQLAQDPNNRLVLCDGKYGESLGMVGSLPGIVGPVAVDGEAIRGALAWAAAEMRRRYESGDRAGRVIVVFDEFQEFRTDQAIMGLLSKIARQGRAALVGLLLGTQHPSLDAFGDDTTRRNLTGRLALRVGDFAASRVAIGADAPRADRLLGQGDGYAVSPAGVYRIQGAFSDQGDYARLGQGEQEIGDWLDVAAEDVGQELPTGGKASAWTCAEIGVTLASASRRYGRPAMASWMVELGLGKPGAERGIKLLALGRETLAWLQEHGLDLCETR